MNDLNFIDDNQECRLYAFKMRRQSLYKEGFSKVSATFELSHFSLRSAGSCPRLTIFLFQWQQAGAGKLISENRDFDWQTADRERLLENCRLIFRLSLRMSLPMPTNI